MIYGLLFTDVGRGYPKVVITEGVIMIPLGEKPVKWIACASMEEARSKLFKQRLKIKKQREKEVKGVIADRRQGQTTEVAGVPSQ